MCAFSRSDVKLCTNRKQNTCFQYCEANICSGNYRKTMRNEGDFHQTIKSEKCISASSSRPSNLQCLLPGNNGNANDSVIQLASSCTDQNVTQNNQRCDQPCEKNVLKSTATSRHPDGFKANELKPDKRTIGSEHKLSPIQNISGNRMLRSSVRPFLCCGSQLSLNSVSEFIELETTVSEKEIEDTEFTDLSDCDEVTDLMSHAKLHDAKPSKSNLKLQDIKASQKKMQSGPAKSNVRRRFWTLKLKGKLTIPKRPKSEDEIKLQQGCVCKAYTRKSSFELETDNDRAEASAMYEGPESSHSRNRPSAAANCRSSVGNLSPRTMQELFLTLRPINFDELGRPINFDELYPTEDIDERRIAQRRKEMEEGIDVPDIWVPQNVRLGGATGGTSLDSSEEEEDYGTPIIATFEPRNNGEDSLYGECSFPMIPVNMLPGNRFIPTRAHSTVDYIHCLVPDILEITKCSFYWGVMDRYQAEKLLENKPEGTFLLRDSAQDDYLFSVSFRRYGRSLHARIEQWNHKFSFDSHDPGVFASDTVCGLIDHYKDPTCCMFFEPMLTIPLHRNFPFSLQHLCRATISNHVNYDSVGLLPLPKTLRQYMRFYHYKQKIRMRRLDTHI